MAPKRQRGMVFVAALAILLWVALTVPLASGHRTLLLRDVFSTHLPLKAFGAEQLRQGRIPALNPEWGLGQLYRGNPNTVSFYPGNLLYLLLPFWSAFNLHYAFHWLLAALTMYILARTLRQSKSAALMAAFTYAGGGWVLTSLSFYNILTVSAWWPLVMVGAVLGGRRGVAIGGVACGMALLGGEPVTAALGLVPLAWIAMLRFGPRRGFALTGAIGGVGLLIALPQAVATLKALQFTVRGAGLLGTTGAFHFHPVRLLELLVPFPFGQPGDFGALGFWAPAAVPRLPYVLTLYCGAIGIALALAAMRKRRSAALLAVAGLVGGWLGGLGGDLAAQLSGGLARSPEKLLFWFALVAPLLAGWGLDRVLGRPRRWSLSSFVAGGLAAVAVVAALFLGLGAKFTTLLERFIPQGRMEGTAQAQVTLWVLSLALLALLLALAGWAAKRRSATGLLLLQMTGLLQLYPLWQTDKVAAFSSPYPWTERVGVGALVLPGSVTSPFGAASPRYRMEDTTFAARTRIAATDLDPAPGVLHGLSFPLAPDLDGMHTPPFGKLIYWLPQLNWSQRLAWLRILGIEALTLTEDPGLSGLTAVDQVDRFGVATYLLTVQNPAPEVWWPRRLHSVANGPAAFLAVAALPGAIETAVVISPLGTVGASHDPTGRAELISATPDRLEIETEGRGGVVVVRRAYRPELIARCDGERLETFAVNFALLGVQVPPGRQRVVIHAPATAERVSGGIALTVLALALTFGLRRRR